MCKVLRYAEGREIYGREEKEGGRNTERLQEESRITGSNGNGASQG